VVVCAWLPEPCPAATGGSGFTIETGSESAIGININFVDVLLRMGKLAKEDYEAWRLGTLPYLERAIRLNLSQLKDMLRTSRTMQGRAVSDRVGLFTFHGEKDREDR